MIDYRKEIADVLGVPRNHVKVLDTILLRGPAWYKRYRLREAYELLAGSR